MSNFDLALEHVLKSEGGFVDHPDDHGGPTNFGITLAEMRRWRRNPNLQTSDIRALTKAEASQIYRSNYWNAMSLDQVKDPTVALILFDQGVNRGTRTAVMDAQRTLNNSFGHAIEVDGVIGPKTVAALNAVSPHEFIAEFVFDSQDRYAAIVASNPSQRVFIKGWINRTQDLLRLILRKSKNG